MAFPKRVVIVEDEVVTQRYLKDIMDQFNVDVVGCFNNGEDTLKALKKDECDMILMDINIKGSMDGVRLTKRILDVYMVPIIFITAHNDTQTFEEVLLLSPYGFIAKPFSQKELEITMQIAYKRFLVPETEFPNEAEESIEIIINDYFTYVVSKSTLYYKGASTKLGLKQTKLIEILCKNLNQEVSNESIKMHVWDGDMVTDASLRTLVYKIRKVLPELPLISHSKQGYGIMTS